MDSRRVVPCAAPAGALVVLALSAGTAPAQDVTISQTFSKSQITTGESFVVEITVDKGDVSGIGKLQQILPEGFSAKEIKLNKGAMSQEGRTVKILWLNLPAEPKFKVSYEITVAQAGAGSASIGGRFSYIIDGKKRNADVPDERIAVGSPIQPTFVSFAQESAPSPPTQKASGGDTSSPDPPKEATTADPQPSFPAPAAKEQKPAVVFRVQIAASQEKISPSTYKSRYKIREDVHVVLVNGWYKYSVGAFPTFEQASAHKDKIVRSHAVSGAFIIAFHNDEYIAVSKAREMAGGK